MKTIDLQTYLDELEHPLKQEILEMREIILESNKQLTEHIKWNAPSYVLDGVDRITFNVMNKDNRVKLVIHMGVVRKEDKKAQPILQDDGGIVQWSSDIRGYITFMNLEDITSKGPVLKNVLSEWLTIK